MSDMGKNSFCSVKRDDWSLSGIARGDNGRIPNAPTDMPIERALCYIQNMLTAITRKVSSALATCELSFIERKPIDMTQARMQHSAYEELLGKLGARIISLPEEPG